MPRARENKTLSLVEYDIAGNAIRAYYDGPDNLIFVLDETVNSDKPNVLLVIDSFDGRKWDDVLANDYGVDLETVRPKRDNKYQKLDIEYGGLDVYSDLISANESGDDLSGAIANLMRFRAMSVRRSARERLDAAENTIEKSRETIERTKDTISELRARVKELRARIAELRHGIGREPTKVSAAKILKAEAQLDAANDKFVRAKKRLNNAQNRLSNAEDDAAVARAILARDVPVVKQAPSRKKTSSVRNPQPIVAEPATPVVDVEYDVEDTEEIIPEPKAEEMDKKNNDEVKPLFDKDPENLDEEMAFKPIDFGSGDTMPTTAPTPTSVPLSFTPPEQSYDMETEMVETPAKAPMTPAVEELPSAVELPEITDESSVAAENLPVVEPTTEQNIEPLVTEEVAPITPAAPIVTTRPVSPVVGAIAPVEEKSQKSTVMYYLMLVLLILLSIGTLWLYQKSTSENIPDLAKTVPETTAVAPDVETKKTGVSPFVVVPNDVKEKPTEKPAVVETPEPIAEPVVAAESVSVSAEPVVESEPIDAEPEPVAVIEEKVTVTETVPVEPEPVMVAEESPFVEPEPAVTTVATYVPEPVKIPTEEEVIASKPGYNVSQNENMFVASDDYDTETVYSDAEYAEEESEMTCEGGAAPDSLGCCPGEEYTYTDNGFMCCNSVECFPPAK